MAIPWLAAGGLLEARPPLVGAARRRRLVMLVSARDHVTTPTLRRGKKVATTGQTPGGVFTGCVVTLAGNVVGLRGNGDATDITEQRASGNGRGAIYWASSRSIPSRASSALLNM